jgi:hypothetical protein
MKQFDKLLSTITTHITEAGPPQRPSLDIGPFPPLKKVSRAKPSSFIGDEPSYEGVKVEDMQMARDRWFISVVGLTGNLPILGDVFPDIGDIISFDVYKSGPSYGGNAGMHRPDEWAKNIEILQRA